MVVIAGERAKNIKTGGLKKMLKFYSATYSSKNANDAATICHLEV
jgi:hypothetical protein